MPDRVGTFDAVIIGGGLGGLSCAALLAKSGLSVVLLEKNHRLGGYAVSYTVKGHRFDIAIQAIGGCDAEGAVYGLLKDLELVNNVRFLPCEPARVYYFDDSDSPWRQPGSWEAIIDTLGRRFPEYRNPLHECYDIWSGILRELEEISSEPSGKAPFGFLRSYPLLAHYGDYSVKQYLDELGFPGELQSLLAARSGYCMLPPDRLSLVGFACIEMTYSRSAWLVEGGIGRLSRLLAQAVEERGGLIKRKSKVISILTDKGEVRGVGTRDGRFYKSRTVVVASAARPALEGWLEDSDLLSERFRQRISGMEATGSYYITYYRVPSEAVEGLWPNIEVRNSDRTLSEKWAPEAWYLLIPSMVDTTAAPPGSHCLCLSIPCPPGLNLSAAGRQRCRRFLEQAAEARFPQLRSKLSFLFDLGPKHLEAISGNPGGSAYGWALIPEQSGIKRLNFKTPVPGLYMAGHWTMPGGGIAGVTTSGRLCAQAILERHKA